MTRRLPARILLVSIVLLVLSIFLVLLIAFVPDNEGSYDFPNGAKFAVAICDDTDAATLENIKPVYDFLFEKGVVSTKNIWMFDAQKTEQGFSIGDTAEDEQYRAYILDLQSRGFEVAMHGARGASSKRSVTESALNTFDDVFGHFPHIHINHSLNRDNLYWGQNRLSNGILGWLYSFFVPNIGFEGEKPESPYYWGDIAKRYIRYSRDFSFHEINLAKIPGVAPYHDKNKPMVKLWFHTSDGHDVNTFNRLLSKVNLDQLELEGGYSIIYTHFGRGFWEHNGLNLEFQKRIEDLANRPVWITTTSKLLAFLEEHNGPSGMSNWELVRVQLRWVIEKFIYGRS